MARDEPSVLILDEPTQGVDVGSKAEIHKLMQDLAERGMAIIMISSELPEILGMSDRIAVMHAGTIVATMPRAEANADKRHGGCARTLTKAKGTKASRRKGRKRAGCVASLGKSAAAVNSTEADHDSSSRNQSPDRDRRARPRAGGDDAGVLCAREPERPVSRQHAGADRRDRDDARDPDRRTSTSRSDRYSRSAASLPALPRRRLVRWRSPRCCVRGRRDPRGTQRQPGRVSPASRRSS